MATPYVDIDLRTPDQKLKAHNARIRTEAVLDVAKDLEAWLIGEGSSFQGVPVSARLYVALLSRVRSHADKVTP